MSIPPLLAFTNRPLTPASALCLATRPREYGVLRVTLAGIRIPITGANPKLAPGVPCPDPHVTPISRSRSAYDRFGWFATVLSHQHRSTRIYIQAARRRGQGYQEGPPLTLRKRWPRLRQTTTSCSKAGIHRGSYSGWIDYKRTNERTLIDSSPVEYQLYYGAQPLVES